MTERNPNVPLTYRAVFDLVEGPWLTDLSGELGEPILRCVEGNRRCKNFAVHDFHYFYCAGQPSSNQMQRSDGYYYPWKGAGAQINDPSPNCNCPYLKKD